MGTLSKFYSKNADLFEKAFALDENGNLIESDQECVAKIDNVIHELFVDQMRGILNELVRPFRRDEEDEDRGYQYYGADGSNQYNPQGVIFTPGGQSSGGQSSTPRNFGQQGSGQSLGQGSGQGSTQVTPQQNQQPTSPQGQQDQVRSQTPGQPNASMGGNSFAQKAPGIMQNLMRDFNLKDYQAAAIVGNLGHETGGFTQNQEISPRSGRGGLGWAQWTGPRRVNFENYAKQNGLNPSSDEANYGYLKHELQTTYAPAIKNLQQTTDGNQGMHQFEKDFESAGTKNYASRGNYTNQALNTFRGSNSDQSQSTSDANPTLSTQASSVPTNNLKLPRGAHDTGYPFPTVGASNVFPSLPKATGYQPVSGPGFPSVNQPAFDMSKIPAPRGGGGNEKVLLSLPHTGGPDAPVQQAAATPQQQVAQGSPQSAHGQQVAMAQQQIPQNGKPSYMAIGDSLAYGVGGKLGNTDYAVSGSNPEKSYGLVQKAVQSGSVKGKNIILSGGASNAGGNINSVNTYYPQMIKALKDGGASNVTVMGVGPYSHYNTYGYHDALSKIAQDNGANYTGPLANIAPFKGNSVQQQVHPTDYGPILQHIQNTQNTQMAQNTPAKPPNLAQNAAPQQQDQPYDVTPSDEKPQQMAAATIKPPVPTSTPQQQMAAATIKSPVPTSTPPQQQMAATAPVKPSTPTSDQPYDVTPAEPQQVKPTDTVLPNKTASNNTTPPPTTTSPTTTPPVKMASAAPTSNIPDIQEGRKRTAISLLRS